MCARFSVKNLYAGAAAARFVLRRSISLISSGCCSGAQSARISVRRSRRAESTRSRIASASGVVWKTMCASPRSAPSTRTRPSATSCSHLGLEPVAVGAHPRGESGQRGGVLVLDAQEEPELLRVEIDAGALGEGLVHPVAVLAAREHAELVLDLVQRALVARRGKQVGEVRRVHLLVADGLAQRLLAQEPGEPERERPRFRSPRGRPGAALRRTR